MMYTSGEMSSDTTDSVGHMMMPTWRM